MDRLNTSGSKPRPSTSQPSSSHSQGAAAGGGGGLVPRKRASLKAHSSAGTILTDDETVDKKPRLEEDVKPRVLADLGNAPRQIGRGPDKSALGEIDSIVTKLDKYNGMAQELRSLSADKREENHYEQLDQVNAKVARLEAALTTWERTYGPRPQRQAHPVPQQQPQAGGSGGGGIAGGTDWHLDPAARQRMLLEQQQQPGGGAIGARQGDNDLIADILAETSAVGRGAGALGAPTSDDGSAEDPYDALLRAGDGPRVRGVAKTQDFDDFVKKAMEGESFEGNANGSSMFPPRALSFPSLFSQADSCLLIFASRCRC